MVRFIIKDLMVIDAYNAMMTSKPYREKKLESSIVYELVFQANKQYDPMMVETFVSKVLKDKI